MRVILGKYAMNARGIQKKDLENFEILQYDSDDSNKNYSFKNIIGLAFPLRISNFR